jgi:hypothetical protein
MSSNEADFVLSLANALAKQAIIAKFKIKTLIMG